jgi:hypothetical protein
VRIVCTHTPCGACPQRYSTVLITARNEHLSHASAALERGIMCVSVGESHRSLDVIPARVSSHESLRQRTRVVTCVPCVRARRACVREPSRHVSLWEPFVCNERMPARPPVCMGGVTGSSTRLPAVGKAGKTGRQTRQGRQDKAGSPELSASAGAVLTLMHVEYGEEGLLCRANLQWYLEAVRARQAAVYHLKVAQYGQLRGTVVLPMPTTDTVAAAATV